MHRVHFPCSSPTAKQKKHGIELAVSTKPSHLLTLTARNPQRAKPLHSSKASGRRVYLAMLLLDYCCTYSLRTHTARHLHQKNTSMSPENPFPRQRAQFKREQQSEEIRFKSFVLYTDLLLEASSKLSYANFSTTENTYHSMKKSQYVFFSLVYVTSFHKRRGYLIPLHAPLTSYAQRRNTIQ